MPYFNNKLYICYLVFNKKRNRYSNFIYCYDQYRFFIRSGKIIKKTTRSPRILMNTRILHSKLHDSFYSLNKKFVL